MSDRKIERVKIAEFIENTGCEDAIVAESYLSRSYWDVDRASELYSEELDNANESFQLEEGKTRMVADDDEEEDETQVDYGDDLIRSRDILELPLNLLDLDIEEINAHCDGLMCQMVQGASPPLVWIRMNTSRLYLDNERLTALGFDANLSINLLLRFDVDYNKEGSNLPDVVECIQSNDPVLSRKTLADSKPFGLSWFVKQRLSTYLRSDGHWPPKVEHRDDTIRLMHTCSLFQDQNGFLIASQAMAHCRGSLLDAVSFLTTDTNMTMLRREISEDSRRNKPIASIGQSVLNWFHGNDVPTSQHSLKLIFPDTDDDVIASALEASNGNKELAASMISDMNMPVMPKITRVESTGKKGHAMGKKKRLPPVPAKRIVQQPVIIDLDSVPDPVEACMPDLHDHELMIGRFNSLLKIAQIMINKIRNCHKYCIVCGEPLRYVGIRPVVCTSAICNAAFSDPDRMGSFASLTVTAIETPELLDLLITFCYAATFGGRIELLFPENVHVELPDGRVLSFMNGEEKNIPLLKEVLSCVPSVICLRDWAIEGSLRNHLDDLHTLAYPLLRWLISSNPSHLRRLKPEEQLTQLLGQNGMQFVLMTGAVSKEMKFQRLKSVSGSILAFHGSNIGNWHSILRIGLKNYSNTKYMSAGAAYGAGVYFANDISTSMGYSSAGTSWPSSMFGKSVTCMALCELINRTSEYTSSTGGIYVVPNEDYIVTRFFLVNVTGASIMANNLVVPQLDCAEYARRAAERMGINPMSRQSSESST